MEKWVQTTGPETPIGDITLNHLMQTLEGVENPDTYNTRRKHLVNFFSVARRYKLVSENVAQGIPRKNRITNVQILTPEQATRLLLSTFTAFTDPAMGASMRAYYAIGLFAGVRPDELKQLTWEDITLRDEAPPPVDWQRLDLDTSDHIFLSEIIAGESRSAPIFPNLRAWLLTCSPRTGIIVPDINNSLAKKGRCSAAFSYRFNVSRKKAGFIAKHWPKDVMRHSFGSYTLALTHNRAQLATIMGNSEDVIRKHYRRHVQSGAAQEFFAIMPPS